MKVMKCCDRLEEHISIASITDERMYIDIKKGDIIFNSGGYESDDIKIKYCPFCGKKIVKYRKPKFNIGDEVWSPSINFKFIIKKIIYSYDEDEYEYYASICGDSWPYCEDNLSLAKKKQGGEING